MPYVNVRITRGATRAEKADLVFIITEALGRVLGKDPAHTHGVVDEVPEQNRGWSSRLTDEIRGRVPKGRAGQKGKVMFNRKWATASLSALLMAVFPSLASAEARAAGDRNPLASASDFRVARPTNALDPLRRFYVDGLGLEVIAEFADHDGFDGLIVRLPASKVQIEFTVAHGHTAPRSPTEDHLLVFYVPQPEHHRALVERMQANGYLPVRSFNPYWDRYGVTFADPDGYRVVVVDSAFPPR